MTTKQFYLRKVYSLDVEVNASGYSKEIREFDEALEELKNQEAEGNEDANVENDEQLEGSSNEIAETSQELNCSKSSAISDINETKSETNEVNDKECGVNNEKYNKEGEDELYDKFEESLDLNNKMYKAFRDANNNDTEENVENSDSDDYSCTTTTSTIMDPKLVRSRVKQSLLKRIKAEKRRIRNKGEASLVTQRNRDINDTIKSGFDF
jgi:hypothetical protein